MDIFECIQNENIDQVLILGKTTNEATNNDGLGPLHYAVSIKKNKIVELLIDEGFSVEKGSGSSGLRPLHIAASVGDATMIELLKRKRARIGEKDTNNRLPLHHAAMNGHFAILNMLLISNPNQKDKYSKTPLHYAIEKGCNDSITILLKDQNINKLLCEAIKEESENVIKYFITNRRNYIIESDKTFNPLIAAITSNKVDSVKLLIDAKFDINSKNDSGCTALYTAVDKDYLEIVKIMIEKECNINEKNGSEHMTVLHCAAKNGNLRMIKALRMNDADAKCKDIHGRIPLYYAIEHKHANVIMYLIVDKWNEKCNTERSLFSLAVEKDYQNIVPKLLNDASEKELFLEAIQDGDKIVLEYFLERVKFEPTMPGPGGWYPIHYAARYGIDDIIDRLIPHCWDRDMVTHGGYSAIHLAASYGQTKCLNKLITNGCDINKVYLEDQSTPLHLATKAAHSTAVRSLLKNGALHNLMDINGLCPVHIAASGDCHATMMEFINAMSSEDLSIKCKNDKKPVDYAMEKDSNSDITNSLKEKLYY